MKKAIILDRDGTINVERGYVNHLRAFQWLPGSLDALELFSRLGYQLVIVTNQAGIGKGYMDHAVVDAVHERLLQDCRARGVTIAGIYMCGHDPVVEKCSCRKPAPTLLLQAAQDHGLDLAQSFMVGDKHLDVLTARAAGTGSVMVMSGYGLGEVVNNSHRWQVLPDFVTSDLNEAAKIIERMQIVARE